MDPDRLIKRMYQSMKDCAIKRNHPNPNFTFLSFFNWCIDQDVFHRLYAEYKKSYWWRELKPSIDRLDVSISYTFDNIRLVTWRANRNAEYKRRKKRVQITITLPGRMLGRIDKSRNGKSRGVYIEDALREWEKKCG